MKSNNPLMRLIHTFEHKWKFVLGAITTVLLAVLSVMYSYLLMHIIDSALEQNREVFITSFIVVGIMVGFTVVFSWLRTKLLGTFSEKGMLKVRRLYATKMTRIRFEKFDTLHSGDLISRGTNDLARMRQFSMMTFPRMLEIPLQAVLAIIILVILSWQLTLIALATIPILIIGSVILSKPIAPASTRVQEKLACVNTVVSDFIKGNDTVKAYQLEAPLKKKNDDYVDQSVESGVVLAKRRAFLEAFSMIISLIPFIVTFLVGGYFVSENLLSIGALLAFINLLNMLTFPLSQFAIITGEAKRDMAAAKRVFDTLDLEEERTDGMRHGIHNNQGPMIELKNVTFRYNGSLPVINNLSLTIDPFKTIALVGPSGGGKSTLAKLIMGFYDSYEGDILIGGKELKTWNLSALRQFLALVSQESFLFPEAIKENIKHGNESANFQAVQRAAKMANADGFINELDDGYDSVLSELGGSLSGGQRQRISIARAILKDAPILILDEATSALDSESETLIQSALAKILKKATAIVIAHRLSTIEDADTIHVIDQGDVKESGTHESLMALKGLYHSLYQKQLTHDGGEVYEA